MMNSKISAGQSGSANTVALAVAAIALCALVIGAADMLAPAAATPDASTNSTETSAVVGDGPGYLPAQLVNQAKDIEPMPPTF